MIQKIPLDAQEFGSNGWEHNTVNANYKIIDGEFCVTGNFDDPLMNTSPWQKIINYSQQKNSIVEISKISDNKKHYQIVTKFCPDMFSMVTNDRAHNFLSQNALKERSEAYISFLSQKSRVQDLYNRIVDEHIKFMESTGYFFSDITGNNILTDESFSVFKIIDVFSLRCLKSKSQDDPMSPRVYGADRAEVFLKFDPVKIFLGGAIFRFLDFQQKGAKSAFAYKWDEIFLNDVLCRPHAAPATRQAGLNQFGKQQINIKNFRQHPGEDPLGFEYLQCDKKAFGEILRFIQTIKPRRWQM